MNNKGEIIIIIVVIIHEVGTYQVFVFRKQNSIIYKLFILILHTAV